MQRKNKKSGTEDAGVNTSSDDDVNEKMDPPATVIDPPRERIVPFRWDTFPHRRYVCIVLSASFVMWCIYLLKEYWGEKLCALFTTE